VGFLAGEATQGECNSLADSCIILYTKDQGGLLEPQFGKLAEVVVNRAFQFW